MGRRFSSQKGWLPLELSPHLFLYGIEAEAVLFSSRSKRLFGLDHSAVALLLRLADGESVETLVSQLNLDRQASDRIAELAKLLAGDEPAGEEYLPQVICSPEPPCQPAISSCYRLLSTVFSLHCSDASLLLRLSGELRHLEICPPEPLDLFISIQPEGSSWSLCFNETPQGTAMPEERLLPMLYGRLRIFAYQKLPYLLTLHAAAVSNGQHAIVLPGLSGTGKSTLAASLLSRGYQLYSDETAVIDLDGNLVPVPLGLGLKESSWDILKQDYPDLEKLSVHKRWDGQNIRYLGPEMVRFASEQLSHESTALCFPRYSSQEATSLNYLSPVETLRALTNTGYQIRGLNLDIVERVLSWIVGLSSFEIVYSSTEEAIDLLSEALTSCSSLATNGGDSASR